MKIINLDDALLSCVRSISEMFDEPTSTDWVNLKVAMNLGFEALTTEQYRMREERIRKEYL